MGLNSVLSRKVFVPCVIVKAISICELGSFWLIGRWLLVVLVMLKGEGKGGGRSYPYWRSTFHT